MSAHDAVPPLDAATRELATRALAKQRRGEKLKRDEERALKRLRDDAEERARWLHYGAIPKRHWVRMSGRQHKILDDQARLYGVPLDVEAINLAAVVRWLHDFIADHTHTRKGDAGGGEDLDQQLKKEKLLMARMERMAMQQQLLSRETIHGFLQQFAARLRGCGDQLQRRFGAEALEILLDTLSDCDALTQQLPGAPAPPAPNEP